MVFHRTGVNPMNYQGNMPSGPVGATLGGLTPQAEQIQEVMAMLGNLNEGQLQAVQQHMQDRFCDYAAKKRGSRSVW